jgi:hypothetical protein
MRLTRQTYINIHEAIMITSFILGGATTSGYPLLGFLFILLGMYCYIRVGVIISRGRAIPFYRRKINWK